MIFSRHPARNLARVLLSAGRSLAVAESCTGGGIARALTDLPGSSGFFLGGVVAYANAVKVSLLGVEEETLRRFGAVSEETCRAMALGVRERFGSDVGLSVTGIAGPEGGSAEKPVGTVYAGFCFGESVMVRRFLFRGSRSRIRAGAVRSVLEALSGLLETDATDSV